MNRHERRRVAAQRTRFFVAVEVIDHDQLLERTDRHSGLPLTISAFVVAMVTPRPPQCGICTAPLTMRKPPRLWTIYTRLDGREMKLAGLCATCAQGDDVAWRAARAAGVNELQPLPTQWGHA